MPDRNGLEDQISQVVSQAVKQIAGLVRADIATEVQRVLGGRSTASSSRVVPAKRIATPEPKKASPSGSRRGVDEATLARVLKVVEKNPGLRSEEIYKKLPMATDLARKALGKLRDTKRVKTTGEKRSMTYATV
jgi:hypothetical protein